MEWITDRLPEIGQPVLMTIERRRPYANGTYDVERYCRYGIYRGVHGEDWYEEHWEKARERGFGLLGFVHSPSGQPTGYNTGCIAWYPIANITKPYDGEVPNMME